MDSTSFTDRKERLLLRSGLRLEEPVETGHPKGDFSRLYIEAGLELVMICSCVFLLPCPWLVASWIQSLIHPSHVDPEG